MRFAGSLGTASGSQPRENVGFRKAPVFPEPKAGDSVFGPFAGTPIHPRRGDLENFRNLVNGEQRFFADDGTRYGD
jgi:hypothetical protein